jgi:hypothetical protein
VDPELLVGVLEVLAHGSGRDPEHARYFGVRSSLGHELEQEAPLQVIGKEPCGGRSDILDDSTYTKVG